MISDYDLERLHHLFDKNALVPITRASKILGISRQSVYNMLKDGRLKTITLGGVRFISIIQEEDAPAATSNERKNADVTCV